MDSAPAPLRMFRALGSDSLALAISAEGKAYSINLKDGSLTELQPPDSILRATNIGAQGKSIWIADDAARRVVFFDPDSQQWQSSFLPTVQPNSVPSVVGVLADGSIIAESRSLDVFQDTLVRPLVAIVQGSAEIVDSLIDVGSDMTFSGAGGSSVRLGQPWRYSDIAVMDADGQFFTVFKQRVPKPGRGEVSVDVVQLRPGKISPIRRRTIRFRTTEIRGATVTQWLDWMLRDSALSEFLGGKERGELKLLSSIFRPPYVPPLRRAVPGPNGSLFLERSAPGSMHHWEWWSWDKRVGAFSLPEGLVLQYSTDTMIWALTQSASGRPVLLGASLRKVQ